MSESAVAGKIARFGVFEFDFANGELRKAGIRIHLQEQPGKILAILLDSAARVVTRDELREAIWPAHTFVDFDHGLNTAIRKLRLALDDDAESPRFIETIARRGYRFLGPVEWGAGAAASGSPTAADGPTARFHVPPAISGKVIAGLVLAAFVIAALTIVLARRTDRTEARDSAQPVNKDESIRRIAVLPFANDDEKTRYISDGLTLRLIQDLSSSASLRVTAPTSSFRYRGSSISPQVIGRQLGVSWIITGSFKQATDRWWVRLEMIDTRDGAQVWGRQFVYPVADLAELQRSVVADTAFRLGITRGDETRRVQSAAAYDLYLRGRYLWSWRTRENLLRAVEYFEKAIEIDPTFAPAWAGLGSCYGALRGNRMLPGSEPELQQKSDAATAKALALDDTLAEAWASRAAGKASYYWDFEGAERDFKRAILLNPSYASAHQWYSQLLRATGRPEEARREIDLAYQLDPFSAPVIAFACQDRNFARAYEEALAFTERATKADPRMRVVVAAPCVQWSQILTGNYEAAIEAIRVNTPADADDLADALRHGGVEAYWRKRLGQFKNNYYMRAVAFGFLHDRDLAFGELERAYADRFPMLYGMYVDPRLDALRSDPRFDELARKIGLPQVKGRVAAP